MVEKTMKKNGFPSREKEGPRREPGHRKCSIAAMET